MSNRVIVNEEVQVTWLVGGHAQSHRELIRAATMNTMEEYALDRYGHTYRILKNIEMKVEHYGGICTR